MSITPQAMKTPQRPSPRTLAEYLSLALDELPIGDDGKARLARLIPVVDRSISFALDQIFFRKGEAEKEVFFRLMGYTVPYTKQLVFAIFCMVLTGLFDAGPIGLLAPLLNEIFQSDDVSKLAMLSVVLVVFFFMKGIFNFFQKYSLRIIGQKVIRDIRLDVYEHILSLPNSYFSKTKSGDLVARLTSDATMIDNGLTNVLSNLFMQLFSIVFLTMVILVLDWRIAIAAVVGIPILVAPIGFLAQTLRRASKIGQQNIAELTVSSQQGMQGISIVKAFVAEHIELDRFRQINERYFKQARRAIRAAASSTPIIEAVSASLAAGVLYYVGRYVMTGVIDPGSFIACLAALFKMYAPFKQLGNINHGIQRAVVAGQRLFEILDEPQRITEKPDAIELAPLSTEVEFRNVLYIYDDGDIPALNDVSFSVKSGEIVAIVGASGSGKSTLVHLIPRFFEVTGGAVLIDGHDVRDVTLQSLRKQIGVVSQDVILFQDTLANNITYGDTEIDLPRVREAIRMAYADEFIDAMPDGLETMVGERGVTLSGGQRQRISIARALYHNPCILILDEATSALDTESELKVQQAIQNLVQDRTTFVVAHRLSTVRNVDRIYVMEAGKVVEVGSHDELLAKGGVYRRLHDLQFQSANGDNPNVNND